MAGDLASLQAALAGTPVLDTEGTMTGNSGPSPWTGTNGAVYNFFSSKAANFGQPGQFDPADLALFKAAGIEPASAEWNAWAMDPRGGGAASNGATFGDALFSAARFAALAYGAGNFDFGNFISPDAAPSGVDLSGFNAESVNPGGFNPGSFNAPLAESSGLNIDKLLQNPIARPSVFGGEMSVPAQIGTDFSTPATTFGPGGTSTVIPPFGVPGAPTGIPVPDTGVPPVGGPPENFAPVVDGVAKPVGIMQMIQNGSSPAAVMAQLAGASSPLAPILGQAGAAGAMPWGSPGNILSIGSGLYGLYQANKLKQMAQLASQRSDPWGQSGGRDLATGQLKNLMQDPSTITNMPGYQAGLQAVERRMASQGFNGSGNMMAALSKYGGDFYNNALAQLAGLSGANANPATSQSLLLNGTIGANDLVSRSLASLGYGTIRAGLS